MRIGALLFVLLFSACAEVDIDDRGQETGYLLPALRPPSAEGTGSPGAPDVDAADPAGPCAQLKAGALHSLSVAPNTTTSQCVMEVVKEPLPEEASADPDDTIDDTGRARGVSLRVTLTFDDPATPQAPDIAGSYVLAADGSGSGDYSWSVSADDVLHVAQRLHPRDGYSESWSLLKDGLSHYDGYLRHAPAGTAMGVLVDYTRDRSCEITRAAAAAPARFTCAED